MNKKIFVFLILLLVVSFGATAFASLTFTTDAITGTTASTIDLGAGNNLFLQTSGGYVGIGTTTPTQALDVTGSVYVSSSLQSPSLFINSIMPLTFNGDIVFKNSALSEKMRIKDSGNVGIGTTTPGSKLSVVGLSAYANNAAALAGGLVAGDLYYTDTAGEYIVKVTH